LRTQTNSWVVVDRGGVYITTTMADGRGGGLNIGALVVGAQVDDSVG